MTPSQTVGPFLAVALPWPDGPQVVPDGTREAFRLSGRLLDGAGDPVPDSLVELPEAPRSTLLAGPAAGGYHLDIHLQGEHGTVFFDL